MLRKLNELIINLHRFLAFSSDKCILDFSGGKDSVLLYYLLKQEKIDFIPIFHECSGESSDFMNYLRNNFPDAVIQKVKGNVFDNMKARRQLPYVYPSTCGHLCMRSYINYYMISHIVVCGIKRVDKRCSVNKIFEENLSFKDHYIFSPLFNWSNEEVFSAINYLGIKLYDAYYKGGGTWSCGFCWCLPSSIKKKNLILYPDIAQKWKDCAYYCWKSNNRLQSIFPNAEAYWNHYLNFDLKAERLKIKVLQERRKMPTAFIKKDSIELID